MANTTQGIIGIIGLIGLLVTGGILLTPEEFEKTYYCSLNEQVGVFDRLSSSGKTGYYTDDAGAHRVSCRSGNTYAPWESLKDYCDRTGEDCQALIQAEPKPLVDDVIQGQRFTCNQEECIPEA